MKSEHFLHLYHTSGNFLRWALLAWVLAIAAGFALDGTAGKDYAEPIYQTVSLSALIGLLLYGLLNVYFGVIKDFSMAQILVTTAALFVGGVGISAVAVKQSGLALAVGGLLFLLGMAAVWHGLMRQKRVEANQDAIARPLDDATIRGGSSVFHYGSDAYRFVERNSTGKNTPAEQFEKKLIRYIERQLEIQPVSMKGSYASYWNIRLKSGGRAELVVLGPGYNTRAKIKDGERWLLRIREAKPGYFTRWIASHFPEAVAVTRDLGAEMQTQFSCSQLVDEKAFFDQGIEVPVVGIKYSVDEVIGVLEQMKQTQADAGKGEAELVGAGKSTLH